jgi:hypothetical protein
MSTRVTQILDEGPYRVYRNLNKKCWSVQHRPGMGLQGWRVFLHINAMLLTDVTFKVSEAGRQRVLSTGRKNVHAYACTNNIYVYDSEPPIDSWTEITYDPRQHDGFVTVTDNQPVSSAKSVLLTSSGRVFAHHID